MGNIFDFETLNLRLTRDDYNALRDIMISEGNLNEFGDEPDGYADYAHYLLTRTIHELRRGTDVQEQEEECL